MKSFFKIASMASVVVGVFLVMVACENESFEEPTVVEAQGAKQVAEGKSSCSAPYTYQCPATGQCFIDKAQAISGGCDVNGGNNDNNGDNTSQQGADIIGVSYLESFCDRQNMSSIRVKYEVRGTIRPTGTICYGYPGSYENCKQINFDATGYGREKIVIRGVNENADFGVRLRATDANTGNDVDIAHDLSVKTESCGGGNNNNNNNNGNNINSCPPSHPIFACGQCWADRNQAVSAGCQGV